MVLTIDVAPTLLDLAGVKVPTIMDGQSLVPLVSDLQSQVSEQWRSQFAYEHFTSPSRAMRPIPRTDGIRTDDFKYVRWFDADPVVEELFDLSRDPAEMNNLASNPEYAAKLAAMRAEYTEWRDGNPSTYTFKSYEGRSQWGAKTIDWDRFKQAHPKDYEKIAAQVERLGVTWEQAVNDLEVRTTIGKHTGFWY
jgi:arylsulfatase A-like enzyme